LLHGNLSHSVRSILSTARHTIRSGKFGNVVHGTLLLNFHPSCMDSPSIRNVLFDDFKYSELKPNLYLVDVLGDKVQVETNSEWRKLGERIARHIAASNQSAVLLSTLNVDDLTSCGSRSTSENSARFEHEGKTYIITPLEAAHLEQTLPDIIESEEFVFGLNVWLCFFEQNTTAQFLCHDDRFLNEVKRMISSLDTLYRLELTYEMIAAVSDGCEMLWFNPHLKNT
ncbi:hypothetical protein ANCCAN_25019, partial [Ancylostoma caninum]